MTTTPRLPKPMTDVIPAKIPPEVAAARLFEATLAEIKELKAEQRDRLNRREHYTLAVPALMLIVSWRVMANDAKVVEIHRYLVNTSKPLLQRLCDPRDYDWTGSLRKPVDGRPGLVREQEPIPVLDWEQDNRRVRWHLIADLVTYAGPALVAACWFTIVHTEGIRGGAETTAAWTAAFAAWFLIVVHHTMTGRKGK